VKGFKFRRAQLADVPALQSLIAISARATVDDAPEILALQKHAYQSEARLYDDWNLPPFTQKLDALRAEFAASRVLKALEGHTLVGSVRAREVDGA